MAGKKVTKKVAKKTTARKTAGRSPKANSVDVHIDFPQEGDVIPNGGHYAVRIGAKARGNVEVSLDNKKWHPCREAVGYYWFDWFPGKTGDFKLIARAKNGARTAKRSTPRKVRVAA
jgi:hypothetical protein